MSDEKSGQALKYAGQQIAISRSGKAWAAMIKNEFAKWCIMRKGRLVTMEEFKQQLPLSMHPISANAWGCLPKMFRYAGLIKPTSQFSLAQAPSAHNRVIRVWEVL